MRRDQAILEAAADLFLERGFHTVRLDDIGERVGITGPAIYRHFANKEEILVTLFDQAMDHLLLLVAVEDPDRSDPHAVLDALVRAQVDFALADRRLVSVYAREGRSLSDPWRRQVRRRHREHVDRWRAALGACHPQRTEDEIHSAAHACIGMTLSVAQWPQEARETAGLRDLLISMLRAAIAALDDVPVEPSIGETAPAHDAE